MVEIGRGRKNRKNISSGKEKEAAVKIETIIIRAFFLSHLSIFGMYSFDFGGFLPYKNLLIFPQMYGI
jgi:hypothetical protein